MEVYKKFRLVAASIILCLFLAGTVFALDESPEFDSAFLEEINMIQGELVSMKVYGLTRVSVTDPSIADIADADDEEILLVGQQEGQTALFIWDEKGKRTVMVYVYGEDLDRARARITRVLKVADIYEVSLSINKQEGKIYVTGEVPEEKSVKFDEVMGPFSDIVVNLSEEEVIEDLVQVDLQVTELSETLSESLGINWQTGGVSGLAPSYSETLPNVDDDGAMEWFKIGSLTRAGALNAQINALVVEGKGRILSKPKLIVISGEEASFLVGGEVPIRTTTFSDTGSSQENVSFKSYGLSMSVTPTIKDLKVDVVMNIEVSDIDPSTASSISEEIAFSTRSANTHLLLDDGQTIVLAGFIKTLRSETNTRIPFFGDLPIVGILFRSKVNPIPEKDEELAISVTPHIIRQKEDASAKRPAEDREEYASEASSAAKAPSYKKISPHYMGIPKEMTEYVGNVQRKISQSLVYPREARQYGWEGTVRLGVLILNDGTLAFALIKESSGYEVFDEAALSVTKKLAPFSAFPPDTDLKELSMTMPIVYSLNNMR